MTTAAAACRLEAVSGRPAVGQSAPLVQSAMSQACAGVAVALSICLVRAHASAAIAANLLGKVELGVHRQARWLVLGLMRVRYVLAVSMLMPRSRAVEPIFRPDA